MRRFGIRRGGTSVAMGGVVRGVGVVHGGRGLHAIGLEVFGSRLYPGVGGTVHVALAAETVERALGGEEHHVSNHDELAIIGGGLDAAERAKKLEQKVKIDFLIIEKRVGSEGLSGRAGVPVGN
ncbi:hypothetical protein FGB62_11g352 [Gracilaria domingensis]|nr:hypothetical protein FGB62_11g352 [Gracilaria domingensis]